MKFIFTLILILVLLLFIIPNIGTNKDGHESTKFKRLDHHIAIEKYFQSDAEPTSKDALWTASNIFRVAVFDDGTSRDGYAIYVCEVIRGYQFKNVTVYIYDILKLTQKNRWVKLGSHKC